MTSLSNRGHPGKAARSTALSANTLNVRLTNAPRRLSIGSGRRAHRPLVSVQAQRASSFFFFPLTGNGYIVEQIEAGRRPTLSMPAWKSKLRAGPGPWRSATRNDFWAGPSTPVRTSILFPRSSRRRHARDKKIPANGRRPGSGSLGHRLSFGRHQTEGFQEISQNPPPRRHFNCPEFPLRGCSAERQGSRSQVFAC